MKTKPTQRRVKPSKKITWKAFAILNAFGDLWSKKTFEESYAAEKYMELYWGDMKNSPNMSKHRIVPVTVTCVLPPKKKKHGKE